VLTITGFNLPLIVTLSYGLFGLLWIASLSTCIPLSAWYSSNKYGGDAAFDNPLFLLTNKIISIGWGGIYIISCIWVWTIMHSYYYQLAGLVNMLCPLVMGIFTAFFSKRFPARFMREKLKGAPGNSTQRVKNTINYNRETTWIFMMKMTG
jgi:hypothetical protein